MFDRNQTGFLKKKLNMKYKIMTYKLGLTN